MINIRITRRELLDAYVLAESQDEKVVYGLVIEDVMNSPDKMTVTYRLRATEGTLYITPIVYANAKLYGGVL